MSELKLNKRFMLFAGNDYNDRGGIYDVIGVFESEEKAIEFFAKELKSRDVYTPSNILTVFWNYEWAYIYDIVTSEITKEYNDSWETCNENINDIIKNNNESARSF